MKKAFIIGLTGASGCGKTTVCEILKKQNIAIINTDKIARDVVCKNSPCLELLCDSFGDNILNDDGTLNRKKLAFIAFADKEKTDLLNKITHPFIVEQIKSEIDEYNKQNKEIIVIDASQLFESKTNELCDCTAAVIANRDNSFKRIINRDNIDESSAKMRLERAFQNEWFISKTDFVIYNDSTLNELEKSVDTFICELRKKYNI